MKKINIPTTEKLFYRQFLEILRSVPPISKLRPKELAVLAEIMNQNNKYAHLPQNIRKTMVFSTQVRKEMRDTLNMGEDSFNNNISILRKWKILSKDNDLNKFFEAIVFQDNYSLEFIFKNKVNG